MRKLQIIAAESIRPALRDQSRHSPEGRFLHRLHCLLLVSAGQSCYRVAELFGDDPRTIERWVREFQLNGIEGLRNKPHPGRPASLADAQMKQLALALENVPRDLGYDAKEWNSKVLRDEVLRRFGVQMSVRNGQRLFKSLSQPSPQEPK